jgi:hypothetical protein
MRVSDILSVSIKEQTSRGTRTTERDREEERKKQGPKNPQSNGPNSPSIAGEPMYKQTSGERKVTTTKPKFQE